MRLTVLLFAQLADAVGACALEIEVPEGATVHQALDALAARHTVLANHRDRLAVAVDERYAAPDMELKPGQTIAIIPPVSGG